MKVLGIGNAIVDVICKVDENFLIKNHLIKSTMKLIDEAEFKKLVVNLKCCKILFMHFDFFAHPLQKTIVFGTVSNV